MSRTRVEDMGFATIKLVEDDLELRNGWYWYDEERFTGPWATARLAEKDAKRKGFIIREIR